MTKPESSSYKFSDTDSIMKKSRIRVGNTLTEGPEFILSVAETQDILEKFANSKIDLVILNVDLVASTKISMKLPLDRLTLLIQSFNQEMSLIVREFGGFVLKYVGDAVLAFFIVTPGYISQEKAACARAINCAKCMLKVAHLGINPILARYQCPQMNLRIGIDLGENAIIQSGWDIHQRLDSLKKDQKDNINKREPYTIRKPVYDILGIPTNLAVKMTALANPNHMILGQLVYEALDKDQQSLYEILNVNSEIWNYVNNSNMGKIYHLYTNIV